MREQEISSILAKHRICDYRLVTPASGIFVEQWVRFRCMFGCESYGKSGACPPALPSVDECRDMINGYDCSALIHFRIPFTDKENYAADIRELTKSLLQAEREIFLSGYYKAFLLSHTNCAGCLTCRAGGRRELCVNPKLSRPSVEAMGIDIYKTARAAGYDVDVVTSWGQDTDRFAILLIE